jgi:hypothetical protein
MGVGGQRPSRFTPKERPGTQGGNLSYLLVTLMVDILEYI